MCTKSANVITGHLLKSAEPGGNVVQTDAGSSQQLLHLQPEETSTAGIPQLESAGNEIGSKVRTGLMYFSIVKYRDIRRNGFFVGGGVAPWKILCTVSTSEALHFCHSFTTLSVCTYKFKLHCLEPGPKLHRPRSLYRASLVPALSNVLCVLLQLQ